MFLKNGIFDEKTDRNLLRSERKNRTAAAENETIRKYCGLASDDVVYASGHTIHWTNTNLMLDPESDWYNPYVTGMKTGSLSGHYCLIATLEKDGKTYVAGVFTGQDNADRYGDMTTMRSRRTTPA